MGAAARVLLVAAALLVATACNGSTDEEAEPATVPPGPVGVSIIDAWCEPLDDGVAAGGVGGSVACYMTITAALEGDALVDVVVPDDLAERVTLEVATGDRSVATLPDGEAMADEAPGDPVLTEADRQVVDRLEIPPEETVQLQAGGFQIVLSGLRVEPTEGTEVEMTLVFERAGEFPVVTDVRET